MDSNKSDSNAAVVTLKIDRDEQRETIILKAGENLRLGRHNTNDLILNDAKVSRFHALLAASETGVILSDLGSLNGTFVNKDRVTTPIVLNNGDLIRLGSARIIVELQNSDALEMQDALQSTQAIGLQQSMITILLADVCGYTYLSEALPGEVVANMLSSWFDKVSDLVKSHHGVVDKYIGDCVMAIWQSSMEESAQMVTEAINAALAIKAETVSLSNSSLWSEQNTEFPWRTRISLNTGMALMGAIGAKGVRDFTVIGDTVNVAFRLDDVASKNGYEIILTDACANLVMGSDIAKRLISLGKVALEGRKDPVSIFTLS